MISRRLAHARIRGDDSPLMRQMTDADALEYNMLAAPGAPMIGQEDLNDTWRRAQMTPLERRLENAPRPTDMDVRRALDAQEVKQILSASPPEVQSRITNQFEKVAEMAEGGALKRNTLHLIGEKGPELLAPRDDGNYQVIPNEQTLEILRRLGLDENGEPLEDEDMMMRRGRGQMMMHSDMMRHCRGGVLMRHCGGGMIRRYDDGGTIPAAPDVRPPNISVPAPSILVSTYENGGPLVRPEVRPQTGQAQPSGVVDRAVSATPFGMITNVLSGRTAPETVQKPVVNVQPHDDGGILKTGVQPGQSLVDVAAGERAAIARPTTTIYDVSMGVESSPLPERKPVETSYGFDTEKAPGVARWMDQKGPASVPWSTKPREDYGVGPDMGVGSVGSVATDNKPVATTTTGANPLARDTDQTATATVTPQATGPSITGSGRTTPWGPTGTRNLTPYEQSEVDRWGRAGENPTMALARSDQNRRAMLGDNYYEVDANGQPIYTEKHEAEGLARRNQFGNVGGGGAETTGEGTYATGAGGQPMSVLHSDGTVGYFGKNGAEYTNPQAALVSDQNYLSRRTAARVYNDVAPMLHSDAARAATMLAGHGMEAREEAAYARGDALARAAELRGDYALQRERESNAVRETINNLNNEVKYANRGTPHFNPLTGEYEGDYIPGQGFRPTPEKATEKRITRLMGMFGTPTAPAEVTSYHVNEFNKLNPDDQTSFLQQLKARSPKQYERLRAIYRGQ